ncbi:E3 ubiquitin-protein ligase synoviolin B isoform X1 [Microplitis mediator]|uniref:E3 ubiquitin-protein ligase synoviolin B isoform X1 n=1 Tax=Microplitis mediator TaxID=375433 RepID=UPI002553C9C6|nr:E3 ubiquitin-protein ligase synoviolin B isoform X1 [Microplitis mediator]
MRTAVILLISVFVTSTVIANAYYQKKQFYPSVVYITKSNPSMAVMYAQGLIFVFMTNTFLRKIFFGNLRAAELEHLVEKAWYAVTETCLAFTVFRDDFSPKFIALFTLLLFLKSFHWLAEDRVDYMERSPVITWLFHFRVATLLLLLSSINLTMIEYAYNSTIMKGASVQLVFGFEYAILSTVVLNITIKYILHTIDLQRETPWESKPVFLLYTELVIGLIKVILYVAFVSVMVKLYTLPLFALRPMYFTMRNFKKAFQDIVMSRRAIRNMNLFYPDATPEELAAADNVCIICREEMIAASKKLPCNHIFHTVCLRSWFQRQQTCPTCRLNILRSASGNTDGRQREQAQGEVPASQSIQAPTVNHQETDHESSASTSRTRMVEGATFVTANVPLYTPPFPSVVPLPIVPTPLPYLSTLNEEELRQMEGNLRQAVEARIQTLQRIQLLLDAANVMMNQYQSAATLSSSAAPTDNSVQTVFQTTTQNMTQGPEPITRSLNDTTVSSGNVAEDSELRTPSETDSNACKDNSIASTSTLDVREEENDEASILRRKRLQKFAVPLTTN